MKLLRLLPRFRRAYQALATLQLRESWSRAQIEAWQLERLNAIWQHAIVHVPYYRQLVSATSLPWRFANVAEFQALVPLLPKSTVRANPHLFLAAEGRRGSWVRTGGSTGSPMSAFWGQEAHLEMLRARYRHQAMWGVDIFDRTAFLWGHSSSFKPGLAGWIARLRQPLEDRLRNRLRLSAYQMGHEDLRGYLGRLAAFRPALIYGYSRAIFLLAQEAAAMGFHGDCLKLITLTAEPAPEALVAGIEKVFGVPAVIEYGSVECGFLAGEGTDRLLRVREDMALLETLPRDDGRYEIVVTMLHNPAFPLLRYAIADVTDAPLELPSRGFAVLKNVAGRNNDFVATRTGRFLHSARFDALFKYEAKNIRRFHVRQHADGSLAVTLEVDDSPTALNTAELEKKISAVVEGYRVKIDIVDHFPQTAAGKHRLVVSDLDILNQPLGRQEDRNGAPAEPTPKRNGALLGQGTKAAPQGVETKPPAEGAPAKTTQLRRLIASPELSFIMEAHNGLSARIAEEAGFAAIWASGLSMSAALGVRDSNEASWTQVLEILEFMSDATRVPLLVDGDTGYGNFNNMRRLVQKLEQRRIGGVCIEDKIFPKTNSFIHGTAQPLADIDEFCGRIKAGKDAQRDDDFVIVARVEAFIAGWGLQEALKRAEAYRQAGADAILIHSAKRTAQEVLAFKEEWGDRLPVVIVPTKYYATPTAVFRRFGFAAIIWANHLMRSCISAMQRTAQQIFEEQTLVGVEDRITPIAEVFRLQGAHELEEAEKRYLPRNASSTRAIILAASRGEELGELTASRPKCMVSVGGTPILTQIVDTYRAAGIRDIAVVRGYCKEAVHLDSVTFYDNDEAACTNQAYSLYKALPALEGSCLISLGDVLFKKYIPQELLDVEADFVVAVDANWHESRNRGRYADYVTCSAESGRRTALCPVTLLDVGGELDEEHIHGEWMGFLKVSARGSCVLQEVLHRLAQEPEQIQTLNMAGLLREIMHAGHDIRVIYTTGHWLDIDSVEDVLAAGTFQ